MQLAAFLTADRVLMDLRVRNKAQLMHEVAGAFQRSDTTLEAAVIEAALLSREQLGSTGLGNGFALPHARVEMLSACYGLFARLAKPIAFDAIDGAPVSLVFALLMPARDSSADVAALAAVSRAFRDSTLRDRIRHARSAAEAYRVLTERGGQGQ